MKINNSIAFGKKKKKILQRESLIMTSHEKKGKLDLETADAKQINSKFNLMFRNLYSS